jgi:hypothetical protein
MVGWWEEVVMVKFRFGKRVTPPAETPAVDERLAEAAKAKLSQATPADGAVVGETSVSRPGGSGAAGDRVAPPDLADAAKRLGSAEGSTTSAGGGGSAGGGSTSASGATVGSIEEARAGLASGDPTGLTAVADELAARRPVADLTQGPERQDPFEAIDEAKAGLPGSALREGANSALSDLASRDDGVTGIAEQGSGAVGDGAGTGGIGPHSAITAKETDDGVVPVGSTNIAEDPAFADNPVVKLGKGMYAGGVGRSVQAADDAYHGIDRSARPPAPAAAGDGSPRLVDTPGGVKFIRPDGSSTVVHRDGTEVERAGNVTRITKPDGSSTTQTNNADGTATIVDRAADGTRTTTLVGTPSDDSIGDEFRHVSEGLKDRLAPQGGGGDGHTDPVDDGGVGGPITESALPDVQEALLGGDPRLGGVVDAAGTSGFRAGLDGLDLSRGAGTIRNPDEEHLGGGLEDDPLDDLGRPGASLDAAPSVSTTTEDAAGEDAAPDDPATVAPSAELVDDPIGLFAGSSPLDRSVFGVDRPLLVGAADADGADSTDPGDSSEPEDDTADDQP